MIEGVENVAVMKHGTKLIVEIDLAVDLGLSKSEKSTLFGTTHGAVEIPGEDGLVLNVNCYRPLRAAA